MKDRSRWLAPALIVALAIVLFALSGVFQNAHGFDGVLGGIGWFGFLLCVLILLVWGIVALVRSRRTASA